ncbi:MAG: hypothetical protein OXI41_05725 [Chloroflexota bacterium]|nr:hypothetical protein [Chloroflexota bacterium]MDE2895720.1 hypothetical protein [Chloroflexota bacterium]
MSDNDTLLAYLVPTLTGRHEDTSTEALAYLLTKSTECRAALNVLLGAERLSLSPIVRFQTQVKYDDGSIPDMVGYGSVGSVQLIVESKFWATLLSGQVSGYIRHLEAAAPGVLMIVCPESRIESLWREGLDQLRLVGRGVDVGPGNHHESLRSGMVEGSQHCFMVTSWGHLLNFLDDRVSDPGVRSDILQLKGLAQIQDDDAFRPLSPEDLDEQPARRIRHFNRIVNNAVERGHKDEWLSVTGFQARAQAYGYGRWFRFANAGNASWFGVNHYRWGEHGHSPLWISVHEEDMRSKVDDTSLFKVRRGSYWWLPIYLKTGMMFDAVVDDVTSQLEQISQRYSETQGETEQGLENEGIPDSGSSERS